MEKTAFRYIPYGAFCDRMGLTGPAMLRRDGSAATMAETFVYNEQGKCIAKVIWNFKVHRSNGEPRYMVAVDPVEAGQAYSEIWL